MSLHSRREYLVEKKQVYLKQKSKEEKSKILDEICQTTNLNRNYVIELLQAKIDLKNKQIRQRKSRKKTYGNEVSYYLKKIWDVLDCPCGQRLAPAIKVTMQALIRHQEKNFKVPETIQKKLCEISSATCDRLLAKWRKTNHRKLHGSTKPGSLLKKQIPIVLSRWDETEIGFSEIDLVSHNGGNSKGDFANTLVETDLATGWTEQQAFIGKAQKRVLEAMIKIDERRIFDRKGIDSDGGSEFINWNLYNFCKDNEVIFTRGRPGKKNDNAHVEQKNWTHVRKLVGYHRYETKRQVDLLNDLYCNEWRLYENFFQSTIKLKEKKRIDGKLTKKYETAKTPYQRLMESDQISTADKIELEKIYLSLNPAQLKRDIERKLKNLFKTIYHKSNSKSNPKI